MQKGKLIEQKQLKHINQINEGLFSKFFKKLLSSRIYNVLKMAERDPQLRAATDAYQKATEDLYTNMKAHHEALQYNKTPTAREKVRKKILKKLGLS